MFIEKTIILKRLADPQKAARIIPNFPGLIDALRKEGETFFWATAVANVIEGGLPLSEKEIEELLEFLN